MSEPFARNFGSSEALLKFFKDKADDIESVSICTTKVLITGAGGQKFVVPPGMVLHMVSGLEVISADDAEMLLNDGLLNRLKIKIDLMRGN